jgi:hypothetical protein
LPLPRIDLDENAIGALAEMLRMEDVRRFDAERATIDALLTRGAATRQPARGRTAAADAVPAAVLGEARLAVWRCPRQEGAAARLASFLVLQDDPLVIRRAPATGTEARGSHGG